MSNLTILTHSALTFKRSGMAASYVFSLVALLLFTLLFSSNVLASTVFMAGDSTMAIKDPKDYPETGWGVPFSSFFDPQTQVINLAKNGRSTRTFITEGLWQQIADQIQVSDTVFIQFGHNDQSKHKVDRYTTAEQYVQNLTMMVNFALKKDANVVLMTPITRRNFDNNGKLKLTHPYAHLVRDIAKQYQDNPLFTFVDMEILTREHFDQQGPFLSSLRFMHIEPDLHPNYPNGITDNTHLNQLGAREVAQIVLTQLKQRSHSLVSQLRTPDPKHLKYRFKGR